MNNSDEKQTPFMSEEDTQISNFHADSYSSADFDAWAAAVKKQMKATLRKRWSRS